MQFKYQSLARAVTVAMLVAAAPMSVFAAERGTEQEAVEMVKKAVALIKSAGPEKAYKVFTEHPDGAFKDRDLYVFVYDFEGNCLAQGANPRMVGKNLIGLKDYDGNAFIKGMIDMVKASSKGVYGPYKFTNPNSQGYEWKKSYCERGAGDTMVCVGTYFVK
ncbi:cache domain-containing protein [Massilia sp. TS11]|uniref:cache domain-containing protein n=1 Tax=Massilia sp. TS11 TaxID=2908003 RepID=UPI001EDA432C|nr:cache domain-containing protein [Massilia sp. TS11]MCG2583504.1 cache domain-containing protein [Massilia sp. TS11]